MDDITLFEGNNELNIAMVPILVEVEVSRLTFDGTATPSLITKREGDGADHANQFFKFNIKYKNNLGYPVWLHPFFAFGTWVGEVFIPYSPQCSFEVREQGLIEANPRQGKKYDCVDDWVRLGGAGVNRAAKNMSEYFPDDNLYTERAYLKVPAGGSNNTGFDGVGIGAHARSKSTDTGWGSGWYEPPCLACRVEYRGVVDYGGWRQAFPPLDLDIAIKSKVYRCDYYEETGHGYLVDTGTEVWGGLLNCAHITNAWGSWIEYHSGDKYKYTWCWVKPDNGGWKETSPPDWWE